MTLANSSRRREITIRCESTAGLFLRNSKLEKKKFGNFLINLVSAIRNVSKRRYGKKNK